MENERKRLVEALAGGFLVGDAAGRLSANAVVDALDAYLAAKVALVFLEPFSGPLKPAQGSSKPPPSDSPNRAR